jgi:TonB family protein
MLCENSGLLSIFTFVLWFECLGVGTLGFLLPYAHPQPPPIVVPPIHAELLDVQIAQDRSVRVTKAKSAQLPRLSDAFAAPQAPSLMAVVVPNAVLAFAQPVAQLPHAATVVQQLTYGEGEGEQPAPEYPRESVVGRQQGVVVIRFVVDESGRVISADAVAPCAWPLLNQAALRAVTQSWRFVLGPMRSYEVSIQFQLRQRTS